jgi:hypothetical protein
MNNLFLVELIATQALKIMALRIPGLAIFFTGPLSFVGSYFLKKGLTFLITNTVLGLSIIKVELETEQERKEYEASITEAYNAVRSKKQLSQEEQDRLEAQIIEATKNFIHIRQYNREQAQTKPEDNLSRWQS